MEIVRKIVLIFCIGFFSLGCSHKEKTGMEHKITNTFDINQYIFPEAKDITAENFVENLKSEIKHYNYEPIFYFRTNKTNCLIEIYVNGVREFKDYKLSNFITPIAFGSILKSGNQKVTVKMYPVGNLNNESWGKENKETMTKLAEDSSVEISVVKIDEKSSKGFDDEKLITKQVSPKDIAGKDMYEFSFTFDAQVPYEFEGWTKGQDLRKLDQELVRKKAVEFYVLLGEIHLNKNLDARLKLDYPSTVRIKSSYFANKENLVKTLATYKENITGYDYRMEPIEDFKTVFMGDGKLLRLNQRSLDDRYRGKGALILKYGKTGEYFPGITLFLPEGRDLATQGFMMWK